MANTIDTINTDNVSYGLEDAASTIAILNLILDIKEPFENSNIPLLCGQPIILFGTVDSAPAEANVPSNWIQFNPSTGEGYMWNGLPSAEGQLYITSNGKIYIGIKNSSTLLLSWVNYSYSLPVASSSTLGGVKPSNGLSINASGLLTLDLITSSSQTALNYKAAASTWVEDLYDTLSSEKEGRIYKVTSWLSTPMDTHYPSEKLVKDSLDAKLTTPVGGTSGKFLGIDNNSNIAWINGSYVLPIASNRTLGGVKIIPAATNPLMTINSSTGALSLSDKYKQFHVITNLNSQEATMGSIEEAIDNGLIPIIVLDNYQTIYYYCSFDSVNNQYIFKGSTINTNGDIVIKIYFRNAGGWIQKTKNIGQDS